MTHDTACDHAEIRCIGQYDYRDHETGYRDSGEIWECVQCGARFDVDEAAQIMSEREK